MLYKMQQGSLLKHKGHTGTIVVAGTINFARLAATLAYKTFYYGDLYEAVQWCQVPWTSALVCFCCNHQSFYLCHLNDCISPDTSMFMQGQQHVTPAAHDLLG